MLLLWVIAAIVVVFGVVVFRGAPYVPSLPGDVRRAFEELYSVSEKDVLVDVGSGDGVVLRLAAERGAHVVGYEINPLLVVVSRLLAFGRPRMRVQLADFWFVQLPQDTTIVYAFSVSRDMRKMATKLQQEAIRLGRPLYFMSYGSEMKHQPALRHLGAHHLYRFEPLQEVKA